VRRAPPAAACRAYGSACGSLLATLLFMMPTQTSASVAEIEFDIPAGPLSLTLIEIGRFSGQLVSFLPERVATLTAPAVQGRLTLLQALTLVTQPSGLVVELTPGGAVTVREVRVPAVQAPAPPPVAEAPPAPESAATVLPLVEVVGSPRARQAEGWRGLRGWSATRSDTPLSELPQAVSVLTAEALAAQGGATTLEALRYIGGVTETIDVFGSGGLSVPSHLVRGFAASYALSGMATARGAVPADMAFIEHVEVLKGPSGMVAGFATDFGDLGGTVNLVRKQAGPGHQTQWSQSLGSADGGTLRLSADLGGDLGALTSWRLVSYGSRSGRSEGGYVGKSSGGLLAALNHQGSAVSVGLTLQVDGRRSVPAPASLGLRVVDGRFAVVPPEDGQVQPEDPTDRVWSRSADLQFDLDWRLSPRWRVNLRARTEAVDNDTRRNQPFTPPVLRRDRTWQQTLQSGLVGDLATGPARHQVLLGLDLQRRHLLDEGINDVVSGNPLQRATLAVRDLRQVLLLQDQISLGRWRVRLAAQRAVIPDNDVSVGRTGDALQVVPIGRNYGTNWDAGALVHLTAWASMYAGTQSTIEAGRYSADDFVLADGSMRVPARMRQVQAGLKLDGPDRRLAMTVEVFRIRILNQAFVTNEGLRLLPGRYVNGLEAELSGRPVPALDLTAGLTVMGTNDVLYRYRMPASADLESFEAASTAIPARSLNVLARYRLPDDLLAGSRLGLGLRAASSTLVGPPPQLAAPQPEYRLPGGALLDLSLERTFGPWAVNMFVNNLLDRRLFSPSYQLTYLPLQPGRQIGLTATYKD
jgi:iron complex outermembrane recepter protein